MLTGEVDVIFEVVAVVVEALAIEVIVVVVDLVVVAIVVVLQLLHIVVISSRPDTPSQTMFLFKLKFPPRHSTPTWITCILYT